MVGLIVAGVVVSGGAPTFAERPELAWAACPGASNPDLRCAKVTVPLDYRRPQGSTIEIAVSRLPATDPVLRRGVLLGEHKVSYFGGSYAGMLGATYSTLFPNRVDRFVLDSPVNGDTIWRPFEPARTAAFEAGLDTFAAWVAMNGGYGFGATAAQVKANLRALLDRAAAAPIEPAGTHGPLASWATCSSSL